MSEEDECSLIDIGANLTSTMFDGVYNEKRYHDADLNRVLQRALDNNVKHIICTAGCPEDIEAALKLINNVQLEKLYIGTTVGVHPTRCNLFEESQDVMTQLLDFLREKASREHIVSLGEFGLDYERLEFCPSDVQVKYFDAQLNALLPKTIAQDSGEIETDNDSLPSLPLFLHCRAACDDLIATLKPYLDRFQYAVVHSFDGTLHEAKKLLSMHEGIFIGLNGCSLRTEANLETAKSVPLDRLMIETDAPWCGIRASHAGAAFVHTKFATKDKKKWMPNTMVKGRNEPAALCHVAEVVAALHQKPLETVLKQLRVNTLKVFSKLPK